MNNDILDLVGKRLIKGEEKYGHENVASDGRDFVQEALEEALDCAVYLAARLVEIQQQNKGVEMGRAIEMENRIDDLTRRLKLVEDALEEMIQTRVHHVDLTDDRIPKAEGVEVMPDETTTTTTRKRKTKREKTATVSA